MSEFWPMDECGVVRQSLDAGETVLIGDIPAQQVDVARHLHSTRGYWPKTPQGRALILARHDDSQGGVLEERFAAAKMHPQRQDCR